MHEVQKIWGKEMWWVNEDYCVKTLHINPGFQCSLHRHIDKDETFIVQKGRCLLEHKTRTRFVYEGTIIRIFPGEWHRFGVHKDDPPCIILECSTHHDDDDVERLEPSGLIHEKELSKS